MAQASIRGIEENLRRILSGIFRRNGRPITKEPLEQLCSEVEVVNKILYDAVSRKKKIGNRELGVFQLAEEDISIKQSGAVEIKAGEPPKPWPRVKVTVNAVFPGDKVEPIRFVYIPAALDGVEAPHLFPSLSSPSSVELTEAAYFFWGAKPADEKNTPITEKRKFSIIKNSQSDITIQLKWNEPVK
jgi:hypothetical protein